MLRKSKLVAVAAVVAAILPLSACGGDPTSGGGSGSDDLIARAEVDSRSVLVAALLDRVRAIDAASFERSC